MRWPSGWLFRLLIWRAAGVGIQLLFHSPSQMPGCQAGSAKGSAFLSFSQRCSMGQLGPTCMTAEDRIRPKQWELYRCWSVGKRWFINLILLTLITTLKSRYYYNLHFTEKKTEVEKVSTLPSIWKWQNVGCKTRIFSLKKHTRSTLHYDTLTIWAVLWWNVLSEASNFHISLSV